MNKKYLIITCFLTFSKIAAQHQSAHTSDTLSDKDYEYLAQRIVDTDKHDIKKISLYSRAYLLHAKSEKNWVEISNGYKNMLHLSAGNLKLIYADSMIYAARKSGDDIITGSAYLTKGAVFYDAKEHNKALDNYVIANEYISKTDDAYLKNKIKYSIAHIKYYLGFYDESMALFRECMEYFKNENDRAYLNAIHSLGLCYNRMGKYDECSRMNKLGLTESKRLENTEMIAYFNHSEGINGYFKMNYIRTIDGLLQVLPGIIKENDFANETVGYFYIGKSYWALDQREKAIPYFLKVDNAFMEQHYIRPDLRENYELLINYYRSNKSIGKQLKYIDHLLKADSLLDKNFRYLSGKIHKEYDTKSLLRNKKSIENALTARKYFEIFLIGIIIVLALLSIRFFIRKAHYKRKFIMLMNRSEEEFEIQETETDKELDINPDVIAVILKQLEKFEANRRFLDSELNITRLSSQFDSNVRYVSKVIAHYKHKKYIDYVNDLRVDYIINLIKQENKYRNYTLMALAEEAGFKTSQHFTKAFQSRTGISATFFIREIKKSQPTGDLG